MSDWKPRGFSECSHQRWAVYDNMPIDKVRCTDCGASFPVTTALNDLQRRLDECIRMVMARLGMPGAPRPRPPIEDIAAGLIVQGGRAMDQEDV